MKTIVEVLRARELFVNLTLRELRSRYKRSALGWAWSLLNPLSTMIIFSVVFRYFLKVPVPRGDPSGLEVFAFYLLCGLLSWNLLANALGAGMQSLVGNANLIKKVYFPRNTLVAATTAAASVTFLIELTVLAVALLVAGNFVIPWLVPVLAVVAVQALFVYGIAMLVAVVVVYFRDLEHLMGIFLQFWFYATPIVYPIFLVDENAPEWISSIYRWNPMTRFVEIYRDLLYDLRSPALGDILFVVASAVVSVALGSYVFGRLEPRLAEEL